jgi:thiol-disulfide isomerase/thioredoxin
MPSFIGYIKNKITPYSQIILVVTIVIIFIIISIYAYSKIYKKEEKKNNNKFNDVANKPESSDDITVLFFHVDWCPHCRTATPKWQTFCENNNNKLINGFKVICNREGIDCTDDNDIVNKYNIESYPTVIAYKGNKRYDYDASIDKKSLEKFVEYISND